jgi:hypothetical protein
VPTGDAPIQLGGEGDLQKLTYKQLGLTVSGPRSAARQQRSCVLGRYLGYGIDGLGNNVGDDETPASVGIVQLGGPVKQIGAGARRTCAIMEETNEVFAGASSRCSRLMAT